MAETKSEERPMLKLSCTCMVCHGPFIVRKGEPWCPRCKRRPGDGWGGVA